MLKLQHRYASDTGWRKIAALLAVLCLVIGLASAAQAGWRPEGGLPDFGADAVGAAKYALKTVYGFDEPDKGVFLDPKTDLMLACHSWVAGSRVCGLAEMVCLDASHPISTFIGCLSSLFGYPNGCPTKAVGNPIDPITGNKFERAVDFATASGPTLSAPRYYNSDNAYLTFGWVGYSRFGYGWRSEYDRKLMFDNPPPGETQVDAISPDGNPLHFIQSGGNWVLAYWSGGHWLAGRSDCYYTLTTDGTNWYLKNNADTTDVYDNNGVLRQITYRGGYTQTLTYDGSGDNTAVADSLGRQLTFAYSPDSPGLALAMTDPDGGTTRYSYLDRSGLNPVGYPTLSVLQKVTYPATSGTPNVSYLYEDTLPINQFALTGITDEDGNRYATWNYDSQGRALLSTHNGGADFTAVSYNDQTNSRIITNAFGKQSVYSTNPFQGVLQLASIAGLASANTAPSITCYAYDSSGYVSQSKITGTDCSGSGNTTTYVHNSTGQETSRTEGYGSPVARTITTTWDATWREPDEIVQPNLTTDFTYDTSGRLTQLKETDTTTQSIPYSTNGQTRIWAFTYYTTPGLVGLLNTVQGPLGSSETTTYTYNSTGFVNSIADPLGHVTWITMTNGRGQPLTSIDPNGDMTTYTYDPRGRILTITVNPGAAQSQTAFTYDLAGNITQITLPNGATLTYAYDQAHRLTSVTNNLGESINYTLDALGNRTRTAVQSASATITKQQTATFDELGRVMANIGAAGQTTTHAYDINDNEIQTVDPRGKVYGHAFDALNRLYQQIDPDSFTTTTAFDAQDNPVSVTDARSLVTSYVRDGFGDVIQRTSPDTGTTVFWYDANGAVIKQVDARSIETDYTNDVTGRVLSKTFPSVPAENVTYTFDSTAFGSKGVGHLASAVDQSGSTLFAYDALGHVVSETREIGAGSAVWGTPLWGGFAWSAGNSYVTTYTYDPAGNILAITYPSGRIVTYTRDALGRIASISTQQNSGATAVTVASGATYEPFGPLAGLTFGNNAVAASTYDQDYQLTGLHTAVPSGPTIQNLNYGYDPAGNITAITDNLVSGRSQAITYDDLNRVASATATGTYGTESYTYDGVGNRLTLTAGGTTSTYAYSPTANQIATITTGGNTRSFSYQPTGQVSQDVRDPSDTYTFAANDNGRNASATLNTTMVGAYLYNAFEQRVQKTAGSTVTQFVFDRFGHLLEEANSSGVAQKEYIWLDDIPVAVVDDTGSSPVLYYIQTDQLGTPQKITDASGVVVWDGVFDPFGNVQFTTGGGVWDTSQWDNFVWGASLTLTNLRFPGQYADAETALNQNWFRDYDPTIGRYIQSDPLGLLGSKNTYSYAKSNPLIFSDPGGEGPLGFLLGFAAGFGGTAAAGPEALPAAIENGLFLGHLISELEDVLSQNPDCPPAVDTNKLTHIFRNPTHTHNLEPLVAHFGGEAEALNAMEQALIEQQGVGGNGRIMPTIINVGGVNVTVSGQWVEGIPRIGSAYVPR